VYYYCVWILCITAMVWITKHMQKNMKSKGTEFKYDFCDRSYECLIFSLKSSVKKDGESASR